jgi:LPS export ABC transporter permease LptG/LPS export ABC transporter permease LptF
MIRILSRYVFREILSSAFIGALLATFVIFLQQVGQKLFAVLVRSTAEPETIGRLFLLALPPVLPFTIPFGVLVGILIGLGRMSSDGEITAMRAAGISSRRVVLPVLAFAALATLVTGASSIKYTPLAIRETIEIVNRLMAAQLTAEIQPRVFEEQFPNTILYVGDVRTGPITVWRNIFMADLTPPDQRPSGLREKGVGPMITVAREAIAMPIPEMNRIQLALMDASSHEMGADGVAVDISYPKGVQALQAAPPEQRQAKPYSEMTTSELLRQVQLPVDTVDARVELHRRLALPFACIALALVGVPLGIASRKSGKGSGYVTAVFLAFFCYYLAFISLIGLAQQRTLAPEIAVWTPNLAFLAAGVILLVRLERPGDRDWIASIRHLLGRLVRRISRLRAAPEQRAGETRGRLPILPQLIDTYVLSNFFYYFAMLLLAFVAMTQIYTFFELLSDIVKNKIALGKVFEYLAFLTPKLIYDTLPVSVLVGVLVTFGVLTKQNEVIAFRACGVSLHRLATPVLLTSVLMSGGLFAFDHYVVPGANLRQDALRNEIKNRPVQTYLRPDRKWIFSAGSRIYYYRHFDTAQNMMVDVSVYELDPRTFRLRRQISAERAQWQTSLKTWIFQNGWVRDLENSVSKDFNTYQATTFAELDEPPGYFLKEVKQDKQMNFLDLERYIRDLQQSGFDTVRLQVQFHKKFSVPLFALIMAMISIPFGFLVGNRGAMAGIGVSIVVAIAYWGVNQLFEQIGNVNQLPAPVAAWAPDAIFALAGMYLLLRMRS